MSQTRSEVLNLLKQFDQEFTVFAGAEEEFILNLLQGQLDNQVCASLDWKRLSKATFVLPHCYIASRKSSIGDIPSWFARQAKGCYLHQISANETRIEQIQRLASLFAASAVKVLFVKGAAELTYSADDTDFLGRRYMCDIDLLCASEDIERVHQIIQANGYELWDHRLKHWSDQQVRNFSLDRYSHYIYNAFGKGYMELHGHVAVGANRGSYPTDFEQILMDNSRQVSLRGVDVWVPTPDHLLVYCLCHAASKNNNQELVYLDRFYLDEFAGTDCVISPPVLINRRLDVSQLRFLLQLRDILERFAGSLNFTEIRRLFQQIADSELNEMYCLAGSYFFADRFPVAKNASVEALRMSRQRYVSRFMLPLLAERIESIICNRLEKLTEEYIDKQVEKIAVSVERQVVHLVTDQIIDRAKTFMRKRLARILPGTLLKAQEERSRQ